MRYLRIASAVVAIALLAYFAISPIATSVAIGDSTLTSVRRGSITVSVKSVGTLESARSYTVSSELRGNRGKIIYLIEDGMWVEKGDMLVRFDATPFEEEELALSGKVKGNEATLEAVRQALKWEASQVDREIKVAEINVATTQLELSKLVNGDGPLQKAQLKEEVGEASAELSKYKSFIHDLSALEEKGYNNKAELAQARLKLKRVKDKSATAKKKLQSYSNYIYPAQVETAKGKVSQAKIEFEQIKKGSVFRVAKAIATVKKAEQDLLTSQKKLEQSTSELKKTIIKAPFAGIVVLFESFRENHKRKPRVGDTVWQNQPILTLPDTSAFVVKTTIREIDLHKVAKGQRATIRVDAFPDLSFGGSVSTIGALAKNIMGDSSDVGREKYFQAFVTLEKSGSNLRPGMTARISVQSDRAENTLLAPVHAIFEEGSRRFIYKYSDGDYKETTVQVGLHNEDYVQILDGLKEGDIISLAKPAIFSF